MVEMCARVVEPVTVVTLLAVAHRQPLRGTPGWNAWGGSREAVPPFELAISRN